MAIIQTSVHDQLNRSFDGRRIIRRLRGQRAAWRTTVAQAASLPGHSIKSDLISFFKNALLKGIEKFLVDLTRISCSFLCLIFLYLVVPNELLNSSNLKQKIEKVELIRKNVNF